MPKYYYSPNKQKAFLLLCGGASLLLEPSPIRKWKIIKNLPKAWKEIDRTILRRIINEFKYDRLVDFKENTDGSISVVLNKKGMQRAIKFHPENLKIKKSPKWDGKWRILIYDIPEKKKAAREALRNQLIELGFYQVQRSVWVHPYECRDEVDFIAELFEIRNYIHYLTVESMTNDEQLKLHFNLK